jgi:hypothetical protein
MIGDDCGEVPRLGMCDAAAIAHVPAAQRLRASFLDQTIDLMNHG